MKAKILPSVAYLRECFELDSSCLTGLRWTGRSQSHFGNFAGYRGFLALSAWKQAGNMGNTGYYVVRLDMQRYFVHRIIYALTHGTVDFTLFLIDHIDRNKTNNDPSNLRLVDHATNVVNRQKCIDSENTIFSKKFGWGYKFRYRGKVYSSRGFVSQNEAVWAMRDKRAEVYDCIIV